MSRASKSVSRGSVVPSRSMGTSPLCHFSTGYWFSRSTRPFSRTARARASPASGAVKT